MAKYFIHESAEFIGEWSLPSSAPNTARIPGTLTWTSESADLELHGIFKPMQGDIYGDEVHDYSAIHGVTLDSQYISILDGVRSGGGFHAGPAGIRQTEKIRSSWVIVGAHVDTHTHYSEMTVRIPGLQIWLGSSGVQQTIYEKSEGNPPTVVYAIEGVPEETYAIASLPATLGFALGRSFSGDLVSDINVRTSAYLRINTDSPKNLEWFFSQLGKATTLLAFVTGSPMGPDQISAKTASHGASVDILVALRESERCTHRKSSDFFMLRNDMEVDFGTVLSSWYEKAELVGTPSQLALSVLSSKDLWLHVEFLSLMQAFEGFHRATMSGLYTTEEGYEEIRKSLSNAIPKGISSDHRDALKSRIKYGNEISLRKRLDALVERLDLPLRKQILGGDGAVPRSWVETRNYFTHWDQASKEKALDGLEMHHAHVRMRHLLRALYLDFAGIPQSAIGKSLLNACRESQYLIQINNAEYRKQNPENPGKPMMRISVKDATSPDEPSA